MELPTYNAGSAPPPAPRPGAPLMPPQMAAGAPPAPPMMAPPVAAAPIPPHIAPPAAAPMPPMMAPPAAAPPMAPPAMPAFPAPPAAAPMPPMMAPPMAAPAVVAPPFAAPPIMPPPAAPGVAPSAAPLPPPVSKSGRTIPSVRPSAPRIFQSDRSRPNLPGGAGVRPSKVPSVPVLFDNEPQAADANEIDTHEKITLPEIMFEPLHVLDPLCIKWKLSKLSVPFHVPETPEAPEIVPEETSVVKSTPRARIPTSAHLAQGYIRLMGLLFNGTPWDCSIPITDMAAGRGVSVGRDATCSDIVLPEPGISRRHVVFELTEGGAIVITDQNSTNGTFLNGRKLDAAEKHVPLEDGSILTLGDIPLRVEIAPNAAYIPM